MDLLTVTTCFFLTTIVIQGSRGDRLCASLNQSHITIDKDISAQAVSSSGERLCPANACYSLWRETTTADNTTEIILLAQGCWESSGKEDCGGDDCTATTKQSKALNNTKFCCCMQDLCNRNMSEPAHTDYEDGAVTVPTSHQHGASLSDRQVGVAVAACCLTLLAVLVALYTASRRWQDPDKGGHGDAVHLMEGARRSTNNQHVLDHIKLSAVVGHGKYSTVWTGMLDSQQVAIKVFPASYKQYFYNERDIYCLPFMDHPNLLTYFGCSERLNGEAQCLLALSYCDNGCLQDYLRAHCIDGPTFCLMALSIARGLAFLHTQVTKGDKSKPCVCHRDLNTRNILVKADLSCALCDLGLALQISGSHYYCLGEQQHAETKSISDVGTLRYMAPEVLEGAVNLRDCESSLKQIDVYALGLVMWELASRCGDLFSGPTPPYRMPFEAEIGHHPTFEQMQVLVTRKKARPLFAAGYADGSAAGRLVRETVDDCWDQDAEARLTALCVQERMAELSTVNFRGSNQVGVSPTTNNITHTLSTAPPPHHNNNNIVMSESTEDTGDKEGVESTVSEGTVETLLTLSPSEPSAQTVPVPNCKNLNNGPALQPYQGRNPCFERNLMWDEGGESGLVDRSCKHSGQGQATAAAADSAGAAPRVNAPIPFLQNAMAVPKQPNVPPPGTKLAGIISKPLKKFLESKKNRCDRRCLGKQDTPPHDTRVSLDEAKTFTAVLGNSTNKKKDNNKVNDVKVIISPFEEISSGATAKYAERPSSLALPSYKNNVEKKSNIDDIFTSGCKGKLKDLAGRIKTPGDVPPSVRRKRGKSVLGETRFSLYDDRMMEGIVLNETEMESNVSTRSFPSGIEFSGKQVKLDSNF